MRQRHRRPQTERPVTRPAGRQAAVTIPMPEVMGCALHVGPYSDEGRTFDRILAALAGRGACTSGAHLEIYLNDPRRTAPERLKTVLLMEVT